jgi:hypothetical protein
MSQPTAPPGPSPNPVARTLGRTEMALDLAVEHAPELNLVWSAALAVAWKELVAMAGGPIELAGGEADHAAAATVRALNGSSIDRTVVDETACIARAGFQSETFLADLRREVTQKLGEAAATGLPEEPATGLFMAYAQLAQRMAFVLPFYRSAWPLHFRGCVVHSFGLWERDVDGFDFDALTRQVRVHHPCYTAEDVERMSDEEYDTMYDDSVVELLTTRPDDRLILALLKPGRTLGDTVTRAMSFVDRHPADHPHARLDRRERLEVPIVDVDVTRRHQELFGRHVRNALLRGQQFGEVLEEVRFRLDEGGATLESRAMARGLSLPPRDLDFSLPFLVMVARRGTPAPMFALWVDNDDVMVSAAGTR